MKTKESRFQVHDELTAPEGSVPILKGALAGGGQLPNFIGVLAGSPAVLRAYARFRSELRNGSLPLATQQRIALARRRAPGQRVRARHAAAHRPRRRPRAGRDRPRARVRLARRERGRPAALREGPARDGWRAHSAISTRRRARRAGATSRSSRRSPTWRSPPSATSSRGPATCRRRLDRGAPRLAAGGLGRAATRFDDVARGRPQRTGVVRRRDVLLGSITEAVELVGKRWTGAILFVLMDGPAPLLGDQAARARPLRPPPLRAAEGARGRGDRRAARDRRRPGRVEYALTDKGGRSSLRCAP